SSRSARTPSRESSSRPSLARITGSTTRAARPTRAATARTTSMLWSMPVLITSAPMSSRTASIWAPTTLAGMGITSVTPQVFWTVMAVTAVAPKTPRAVSVFRSAWIPAPPLGSEPPTARARAGAGGGSGGEDGRIAGDGAGEQALRPGEVQEGKPSLRTNFHYTPRPRRPLGEIGRRGRLKISFRTESRFEPGRGHSFVGFVSADRPAGYFENRFQ